MCGADTAHKQSDKSTDWTVVSARGEHVSLRPLPLALLGHVTARQPSRVKGVGGAKWASEDVKGELISWTMD